MPDRLNGKIAVVAGASRGCGRGIAVALGEQTATVYVTGRATVTLAFDPNVIAKSGQLIFVGDAAKEYGFTDIDGRYIENFYRATGRL